MQNDIDGRLRRLELTNRILTATVLAIVLGFLIGSSSGSRADRTLQADRVEIVDAAGEVVAFLGADDEGATGLFIKDATGALRASLTHDAAQTALFLYDGDGTVRVGAAQFAHGGGGFALHGENAKGATVLYHKGAGSLSFYDAEGAVTARVPGELTSGR